MKILFMILTTIFCTIMSCQNKEKTVYKTLQKELEQIYDDEQKVREDLDSIEEKYQNTNNSYKVDSVRKLMRKNDTQNQQKVVKIIDKYGWLGSEDVGQKANEALFLVIQHADLTMQKKYFPMMKDAIKMKKVKPYDLALLEDRILIREGKKQIYGSQFMKTEQGTGFLLPVIDPDNLDKRRKSVGLEPIEQYLKESGIKWNLEEYKKKLPEYEQVLKTISDE
jgi:hypothetical protein